MTSFLPKLSFSVLAVSALVGLGGPVLAQQPPAAPPPPAPSAAPAPAQTSTYSEADARAVLNARLAALKAVIELTPDQEKVWTPLETTIRDISKRAAERRQAREQMRPKDFLDILDVVANDEAARAADLKAFVAAAKPLVATLTPEQKRRIPAFLGLTEGPRAQPSREIWIFEEEE